MAYQDGLDTETNDLVAGWLSLPQSSQIQSILYHLCKNDSTIILPQLYRFRKSIFSKELIELAATVGNLEFIRFVSEKQDFMPFQSSVFDCAASSGNLLLVKYLHAKNQSCTTQALDNAAEWGHFEIVEFLNNNRHEGCTTDAMDKAAGNGHLKIVKYLYENRQEGCTSHGLKLAIENGHLETAKYLFEHYESNFLLALCCAASHGHVEIVKYFCSLRPDTKRFVLDVMGLSIQKGFPEVVAYLRTA